MLDQLFPTLPKLILDQDNIDLTWFPNLEEVKEAIFAIKSNKTLDSNGFGADFFKNYWQMIKKDLFNCILECFIEGKTLKEINHTFIALIPKIDNLHKLVNLDLLAFTQLSVRLLLRF